MSKSIYQRRFKTSFANILVIHNTTLALVALVKLAAHEMPSQLDASFSFNLIKVTAHLKYLPFIFQAHNA